MIVMREELAKESQANNVPHSTFDRQPVEVTKPSLQKSSYDPIQFVRQMMRHNVFAAYERFIAGKICQIVLSGNYSPSNIERSKQSVIRVKDKIRKVFEERVKAHKNGAKEYERLIFEFNNSYDVGGWTVENLERALSQQLQTVAEIESGNSKACLIPSWRALTSSRGLPTRMKSTSILSMAQSSLTKRKSQSCRASKSHLPTGITPVVT